MTILRLRHFIALTGLVLGCGSSVTVDPNGADAGSTPTDLGRTGDTPLPDVVEAVDAGEGPDRVEPPPTSCALPRGGSCAFGQTCPAGDGCNECTCQAFSEFATCTSRPCAADAGAAVDAGPGACLTASDCGPDRECRFTVAGCGVRGECGFITDCAAVTPYCSCAGETFLACPSAPERAWVSRGACASDGGVPADVVSCGGASIGPNGRYCAGPTDRPLPLACCTGWNCDQRLAACNSLPPTCAPGETATVAGACWGPCVPAANCAPIRCGGGCPTGWTCDAATMNCRYGG